MGLATVLVGEDPASQVYVRSKHRAAEKAGMLSFDHGLPGDATQQMVEDKVRELNDDPAVDGMIVQLPLPGGLDGNRAVETIDPARTPTGSTHTVWGCLPWNGATCARRPRVGSCGSLSTTTLRPAASWQ